MSENRTDRPKNYSRQRPDKNGGNDSIWLITGGAIVIILIVLIIVVNLRNNTDSRQESVTASEAVQIPESETADSTTLRSGCDIDMSLVPGLEGKTVHIKAGMNRTQIMKEIRKLYRWNVTAINSRADEGAVVKPTVDANETTAVGSGDTDTTEQAETEDVAALKEIVVRNSISMNDPIASCAAELLDRIFEDDGKTGKTASINLYELKFGGFDEAVEGFVQDADDMWYVEAKGGSIESYDEEKNEFLMEGSSEGCRIDKEKMASDLKKQLEKGNYEFTVPVTVEKISPENSVPNGEYTIIAQYVTHTTNNAVRNKNVALACSKLNGTIVRPGEEFSYNLTIGERTAEKGYGEAAAYSNGEVVQEIGGGVCQVSSTLYNAITEAGLKTTYRSPHTFKPTYVTPGQDATVSWNGPDYRFANVVAMPEISFENTYAVGILAEYKDQTVTVSIYGRPVLQPGYRVTMESEMIGETEVVRETIPEGSERTPTTGDKGSSWKTYLHITKDENEFSREVYHTTRYTGHIEYYYESEPESSTEEGSPEGETYPEGYGPGFTTPAVTQPAGGTGPGESSEQETPGNTAEFPVPFPSEPAESRPGDTPDDTQSGPGNGSPGGMPGDETQSVITGDGPHIIEDGP